MFECDINCTYCGKLLQPGVWLCPDCWYVETLTCTPDDKRKLSKQNKRDNYNDYLKKVVK